MLLILRILRYIALFGGVGLAFYLIDGWLEFVSILIVFVLISLFDAFLEKVTKGGKKRK